MALIALEDMRFFAHHGFYKEEEATGGYYMVDVYIETNLPRSVYQDDLYKSINYETVHFICKTAMKKPSKLIESVAARIMVGIKKQFPKLKSTRVRIRKEHPPLGGSVGRAVVELTDDFAPSCNKCKKPLVCFDKPGGCWCTKKRIDGFQLADFQKQFFKCKCLDCPNNP